jgi:hypothetical protein
MVAFNSVIAAATVGAACAFAPSSMMGAQLKTTTVARSATQMGLEQYKNELAETAKKIASPGECRGSLFAQTHAIELFVLRHAPAAVLAIRRLCQHSSV